MRKDLADEFLFPLGTTMTSACPFCCASGHIQGLGSHGPSPGGVYAVVCQACLRSFGYKGKWEPGLPSGPTQWVATHFVKDLP